MKDLFRKASGILLMLLPSLPVFWALGKSVNSGMWLGFLMFLFGAFGFIAILSGFLLGLLLVEIGYNLYKGESLGDNKWLK